MQRVIEKTARAVRVADRRAAKAAAKADRDAAWDVRYKTFRRQKKVAAELRAARAARNEEWERGSLAPRRDVGKHAKTHGAISADVFQLPPVVRAQRPEWIPFVAGDRVVVIRGPAKGEMGVVQEVEWESVTVRIRDVNTHYIAVPEFLKDPDNPSAQDVALQAQPVPLADVRLVYPLPHTDPDTGKTTLRDTIIDRLERLDVLVEGKIKPQHALTKDQARGRRAIAGSRTVIPWPADPPPEEQADKPDDTVRSMRAHVTFRPTLLQAPMPLGVIDELRNKYSRFRTRHTYEFLDARRAEDAREEARKKLPASMRTPLQELAAKRVAEGAARRERMRFTPEQLAALGRLIVEQRQRPPTSRWERAEAGARVDVVPEAATEERASL